MYDISSKKCVTKKFLEVSRCGPAKQQTLDFIERFTFRLGSIYIYLYKYIIIYIYLSGFDKRYLQKFLATVLFEACSVLDHSFFFS